MAESIVPQLVDKKGGSYFAIAPQLEVGKFNKWKKCMLCYLTGIEPYYIQCIKDGHFQLKIVEEYKKVKAKLALLEAGPSSTQSQKPSQTKNKGLVAETFNWDEEEVSDDKEMIQVKGLMALADDELAVNESLGLTKAPTNPKFSKESGSEPQTPLPLLKILKGASPSSEVMPLTYQEQSPNERPSLVPNEVKNNKQESKINELTKLIPMLIDEKVKSSQKIQESKLVISEPELSRSVNSSKLSQ
ncbi:hypothetical protein Tco_1575107 [Tanacetum coccineum]